jgi:hypothetical protein
MRLLGRSDADTIRRECTPSDLVAQELIGTFKRLLETMRRRRDVVFA